MGQQICIKCSADTQADMMHWIAQLLKHAKKQNGPLQLVPILKTIPESFDNIVIPTRDHSRKPALKVHRSQNKERIQKFTAKISRNQEVLKVFPARHLRRSSQDSVLQESIADLQQPLERMPHFSQINDDSAEATIMQFLDRDIYEYESSVEPRCCESIYESVTLNILDELAISSVSSRYSRSFH